MLFSPNKAHSKSLTTGMAVQHRFTHKSPLHLAARPWSRVLPLAACIGLSFAAYGQSVTERPSPGVASGQGSEPLSIQVNDDRMTLALTRVPQVYLFGAIDADAPRRFEGLMRSRKIPPGSDIYLNSPGGDLHAGLALGRLFRSESMVTHLGAPKKKSGYGATPRGSLCVAACAYAYLGGLYRWAVTGNDRIGLNPFNTSIAKTTDAGTPQVPVEIAAYLKEMGIDQQVLAQALTTSNDRVVWLAPEQMLASGLANNGRLPPTSKYLPSAGGTSLELSQVARDGEHKITFQCGPDGLSLSSSFKVGLDRARQLAARGAGAYFQVDDLEMLPEQRASVDDGNQSLVINRPFPLGGLARLVTANSMGAWISDKNGAVRYGFTFELGPVRNDLKNYYASCQQVAERAKARKQ